MGHIHSCVAGAVDRDTLVNNLPSYQYAEIPSPSFIRVIRLQPAARLGAPLRCSMRFISLDSFNSETSSQYFALSYAWDSQQPNCPIECDGGLILVTKNCDAAMRRLRKAWKVSTLWIDSICINQSPESYEERNQQVALMGEIYKNATRVLVWLGESSAEMESSFRAVERMSVPLPKWASPDERKTILQTRLDRITQKNRMEPNGAFQALFERSWFRRMWTVQEVTLPALDNVHVLSGSISIPWGKLVLTTDFLKSVGYQFSLWERHMNLQERLTMYLFVKRCREKLERHGPMDLRHDDFNDGYIRLNLSTYPEVSSILLGAKDKLATNPKDKVFALYGVFRELGVDMPTPNYRKSVENIYREATISCIKNDKSLRVLYFVPSNNRRQGLQSWVPDWSDRSWGTHDSRSPLDKFSACGQRNSEYRFSTDGRRLRVKGKIIDTIVSRGDSMPEGSELWGFYASHQHSLPQDFADHVLKAYHIFRSWLDLSCRYGYTNQESRREAFLRTIMLDDDNYINQNRTYFNEWYQTLGFTEEEILARSRAYRFSPTSPLTTNDLGEMNTLLALIPRSDHILRAMGMRTSWFHSHMMLITAMKCFFLTEANRCGLAPDPFPVQVEAGDRVAAIAGLGHPVLLRRVSSGYKLIAHIYLHGVMYGEAWLENEVGGEIVLV